MPSTRKFLENTEKGLLALEGMIRGAMICVAEEAPTAAGLQLYSVIMVQKSLKHELSRLCQGQQWIGEAPVLLLFCADIHRYEEWLRQNGQVPHYRSDTWLEVSKADAYIFAQAVSERLRREGLGTCFSGFVLNSAWDIQKLFFLPGGVFPVILMGAGWPDEDPKPGPRTHPADFIYTNIYQERFDFCHIAVMYEKKAREKGMTVPELFVKKFYPVEMVRAGDEQLKRARIHWMEG